MKPFLLYEHHTFQHQIQTHDQVLMQDLQLEPLLRTMAQHDHYIYKTTMKIILHTETNVNTLHYRQQIIKDGLKNPDFFTNIYSIASEIVAESEIYQATMKPNYYMTVPIREKFKTAITLLEVILTKLKDLRRLGKLNIHHCKSKGLTSLFNKLDKRYPDELLSETNAHLQLLQQMGEEVHLKIGARIGDGLKGSDFIIRDLLAQPPLSFRKKKLKSSGVSMFPNGLNEIKETVFHKILGIVKRFVDECLDFCKLLRFETGFYVGCLHLHHVLTKRGFEISFPVPESDSERTLFYNDLYDPVLAIHTGIQPVVNDLQADKSVQFVITGANQGGKSTLLRSIGLAQLMMQCGLFVPATFYRANLCDRIFTHFTREEDMHMISGKLDEELLRLDQIMDDITPRSVLLLNEPFSSTTEREGSLIARDILSACYEVKLKVFIVTHFYELAKWAYMKKAEHAVFLSPERAYSGKRTFKLTYGEPESTSYGEDLFHHIIEKTHD
ncbi:MutS-related protein [Gracilibacillus alcaliphilus]|uniref:MutS-related protein n=1 Tax=Gracilibacillus alcaliphilus TaxID=1401441 RepID=UPI00195DD907|nr:hypothetical protein [Gracilibacillus alcaliphilus]MBM7676144.1 hypothetical protein [Gracilibacillus alcaliphilus]